MAASQAAARLLVLAGALLLTSVASLAAPGESNSPPNVAAAPVPAASSAASGDPVSRFLRERGLWAGSTTAAATPGAAESPNLLTQARDRASEMVLSAMNFLGVPYKRGGNSMESGFDCSGFTRHIFEMSLGLVLPHRAEEQARLSSLVPIRKEELKPGDLVFFNTMRRTFSHVGIYVGDGKFIHAPRTGTKVRVEDMREAYWAKRYTGARRAELPSTGDAPVTITQ